MRKSLVALMGVMAILNACGAPTVLMAPAAVGTAAAAARPIPNDTDRLFDTLQAHFQVQGSSLMGMSGAKHGPAWNFITVSPKANDKALTEVNYGAITSAGKITTMISFAARLDRSRNPQVEEVTKAARAHAGKLGTDITQVIVSTNPLGFDKYAYLVIGKRPNDPDPATRKATFFHCGTYAIGTKAIHPSLDTGTTLTR